MSGRIDLEEQRQEYRAAFRRWSKEAARWRGSAEEVEARHAYRDSRNRLAESLLNTARERGVGVLAAANSC